MNEPTIRQNAKSSKAMEDYLLRNYASWVRLAKDLGLPVEAHDLVFVRECTLTGDWATVVWDESSFETEISFRVGLNSGPNAGAAFWGQWQDHVTTPRRRGPMLTPENRRAYSEKQFDQCIFLKGIRVALREWYQKLVSLLMARATEDPEAEMSPSTPSVIRFLKDSRVKVQAVGNRKSSFRPVRPARSNDVYLRRNISHFISGSK